MTSNNDYLKNVTDKTLTDLHDSAARAYANDQNLTDYGKEIAQQFGCPISYFRTDAEQDWPVFVDDIESELTEREIPFTPIKK